MPTTPRNNSKSTKAPKSSISFKKSQGKIPKGPKNGVVKSTVPNTINNKKNKNKNKLEVTGNSSKTDSPIFKAVKKSKKAKNKDRKKKVENGALEDRKNENDFQNLLEDAESDDEVFDISDASVSSDDDEDDDRATNSVKDGDKEIIMVDSSSDDDDEIINIDDLSDSEDDDDDDVKVTATAKSEEKSDMNDDFISFGFSSDNEDKNEYSESVDEDEDMDNEYLSNDEGSYHSKNIKHKAGAINDDFPWIRNSDHSKEREIADWLTSEIKDFVKYISPSIEEIKSRNQVIQNLRSHIKSIWPDAELHCFGSFATDLYLPGSDIDCVVVSKRARYDNKSSLYQLTSYIRNHKLGVEVTPIAKAKVPIIKFIDPTTKIHIDISFERSNGLTAAKLIIDWLRTTPGLRELVLIVKQFLAVRKLNEVHVGGLGGFSIICMCYSFLKLHPRLSTDNIDPSENLGCLLIEFFELYGYNFGYDKVALAFTPQIEPIYIAKNSNPELIGRNPFLLAIQDPHDSSNNISRGSFNLRDIKRAFGGAFELLVNRCYELNSATYKQRLGQSILGGIIKYKGKQRDFVDARKHVKNVAFHAASTTTVKGIKVKSGVLPPLPSEKAGLDPNDFHMSDNFYTSDDDDGDNDLKIFEESQKKKKKVVKKTDKKAAKESRIKTQALLDIKSDEDDDESDKDQATMVKPVKEPDFTDSEDDYDPAKASKISAASAVAKGDRREYWIQKAGTTF